MKVSKLAVFSRNNVWASERNFQAALNSGLNPFIRVRSVTVRVQYNHVFELSCITAEMTGVMRYERQNADELLRYRNSALLPKWM